jgi:hypothetical protein
MGIFRKAGNFDGGTLFLPKPTLSLKVHRDDIADCQCLLVPCDHDHRPSLIQHAPYTQKTTKQIMCHVITRSQNLTVVSKEKLRSLMTSDRSLSV